MVFAYDLLEDRCTIDVIIAKFLPLCFKMAESFENLASILHDLAKDKSKKNIVEAMNKAPFIWSQVPETTLLPSYPGRGKF